MEVKGKHLHIYNRFEKVQSLEQYFKLEFKKTEHDLLQLNDSIVVIPDTKSNLTYFPKQDCDLDTVSQNGRLIAKCKDCFLIVYIFIKILDNIIDSLVNEGTFPNVLTASGGHNMKSCLDLRTDNWKALLLRY
jgi:hypothetical protein